MSETRKDIHTWFGLTYANHLVIPRSLLQSMPDEWQHQFVALLEQYGDAFGHIDLPQYEVKAGTWVLAEELDDAQMTAAGITWDEDDEGDRTYFHDGSEIELDLHRVFVEGVDPVPHYNRGRTHVKRADELGGAA